jgi:hypothetical protein
MYGFSAFSQTALADIRNDIAVALSGVSAAGNIGTAATSGTATTPVTGS